jgi:ribonuclease HI
MTMTRAPFVGGGRYTTVFADASFDHDTGIFGWAAWVKSGNDPSPVRLHGSGYTATSSMAEYEALVHVVDVLCANDAVHGKIVVLQSDSTAAIGRAGGLLQRLQNAGAHNAYFKHVKGHSGTGNPRSAVNDWCDRVARREMRARRKEHYRALRAERRRAQATEV